MKKSRLWLALAVVLFGLAAWLMRTKKPAPERKAHAENEFPTQPRAREVKRQAPREARLPRVDGGIGERHRDKFLAALPPLGPNSKTAVVVEASALKSLPVGRMILRCLKSDGGEEKMIEKSGVGPDQIDRIAVSDTVSVISGDFAKLDQAQLFEGQTPEAYGDHAKIGEVNGKAMAIYDDQYVVYGKDRADVESSLDRLESGDDGGKPAIPDSEAYGEIYGTLGVDDMAKIMDRDQPELADKMRQAAEQVGLHVDATDDVLMVADVDGPDKEALADLGKSLGGALSLGRMQAKATDDDRLGDLLEEARVKPSDDQFRVEVALPMKVIEKELGQCAKGWNDDKN